MQTLIETARLRHYSNLAVESSPLVRIVKTEELKSAISMRRMLMNAGADQALVWPESHRALALEWQAKAQAQGSLSIPG